MSLSPRASLLQSSAGAAAATFPFVELVPVARGAAPCESSNARPDRNTDTAAVAAADLERVREQAVAEGRALGRADAYAEGREAGLAEGRTLGEAAAEARLRQAVEAVERALAEISAATRPWIDAAEENVTALAVAVARQILDRELRGSTAAFAELVRRALAEFPVDEHVRIRLHPSDLAVISALPGPGDESFSVTGGREAAWVADTTIGPGGCLVEGRTRIIDGRVDVALERVYRSLSHANA